MRESGDAFVGSGQERVRLLHSSRFGYLSRKDAALIRDAVLLESDTFLTLDRKLARNADLTRSALYRMTAGPRQGKAGPLPACLDVGGLRRSAAPSPARELLGQRQPDRPAGRLQRGQALRRGADHGLSAPTGSRHVHRADQGLRSRVAARPRRALSACLEIRRCLRARQLPHGGEGGKLSSVGDAARDLGRYLSTDGERSLHAVPAEGHSAWSLIDVLVEGGDDPRLIEPAVESLAQAEAIARDYLPRAHRARRPLRHHPPPDPA